MDLQENYMKCRDMHEQKFIIVIVTKFGPDFYAVTLVSAVVVRIDLSFITVHNSHRTSFLFFDDLHLFLIYNHKLLWFYTKLNICCIVFT